jgi:hypothetical protein
VGPGVVIDEHSLLELATERRAFGAEAVALVLEILKLTLGSGAINGLKDFGGVAVKSLPADAGAFGLSGDGAVGSVAHGGGVGDAELRR